MTAPRKILRPNYEKSRATEADHLRQLQRALERAKAEKREGVEV